MQRGSNIDNIEYALSIAAGALTYYETVFDIDYPLPKVRLGSTPTLRCFLRTLLPVPPVVVQVDMVALPDFAAGAMENWGCVTYRETALLANNVTSSASELQVRRSGRSAVM